MFGKNYVLVCLMFASACVQCVHPEECNGTTNCTLPAASVAPLNATETSQTPFIQEVTLQTAQPPKIMSMMAEEQQDSAMASTAAVTTTEETLHQPATTEPKGRALDFNVNDHSNTLTNNTKVEDLSDVSMDNDDDEMEPIKNSKILATKSAENGSHLGICHKGGLTYDNGEKLEVGCDSICTCSNGKMDCADRCSSPFIRKGKKIDDPFCTEKAADDPCCSVLQCTADTETEPLEICTFNNKTYNRGDVIQEGCKEVCNCEAGGKLVCKPRCPPLIKSSEKCLEIPDRNDPCCHTVICDVTINDNKLVSAKYVNSTTIKLEFESKYEANQTLPLIEISENRNDWKTYTLLPGDYLSGLDSNYKFMKIENTDDVIEIQSPEDGKKMKLKGAKSCDYKGHDYKIGEEFNDGCESFCVCKESGVKCLKLECPTYFGTDVMDPNCIEWETVPANFTPVSPKCCPEELKCKSNGSCDYRGEAYQNWQQIPINITGCEKRCYCEMGKVECQNVCPLVTALPPPTLNCPPELAKLSHVPDDDCCVFWVCKEKDEINGTEKTKIEDAVQPVNETDSPNLFPFAPKAPSKTLGPLLAYGNESNRTSEKDHYKKPQVLPEENIYVEKNKKVTNGVDKDEEYFGPFNPAFKPPQKNPAKGTKEKVKPNKSVFVTPPSGGDNYIPEIGYNAQKDIPNTPLPNAPHIRVHGKGNTDELLQIINQHPEIANFAPGSVVEIHDIPQRPVSPEYINPNAINQPGFQVYQENHNKNIQLPAGITFDQILQEIHKGGNTNAILPYPHFPNNNGQIFLPAPPNRPIFNGRPQQNFSGIGMYGGFPNNPFQPQSHEDITVNILEAIDAHTVRLAFTVPSVIVGLHGRVEVRYTYKDDTDENLWEQQVFAPPNDLIATPQLEFDLVDLMANTEYKIKITVTLRDLHNTPSSKVYTIKTLMEIPRGTLPPMIPIEPELAITDINATWVNVAWRKFTDFELRFIDGVQLRFKEIDGKIYAATPLIHRAVTSYALENLKPNTKYEIGIYFIPFPDQQTELHAENMLHFTTANEVDTYGFNVTLEISLVKPTNVEITWSGVPYPEDKYVNIYRAIYQSDSGKGDSSTFKIAKRDSPAKVSITELKPGTRYRLWLEVYLTNGKIKTSNVQDFITKPRSAPSIGASSKQADKLSGELPEEKGDYYGPLVIVAILAAIAILSTLILLLILVRRHNQNKACITPPTRVSQSAYDNPTYKVEIQQETMDL